MTVDDYIAAAPPLRAQRLSLIRAIAHRVLSDVAESIEWRMPVFRVGERYFAVASQKSYLSLYIGKVQVDALTAAVPGLKSGKGCLNITDTAALPSEDLLAEAIRWRLLDGPAGD